MTIEFEHTEFANATPEAVWKIWSNVDTWSEWDHGIEWCKLKSGSKFELHGKGSIQPKGSPFPVDFSIIECTPNKSFTDEGTTPLGTLQFKHTIEKQKNGVSITHGLKFVPANPQMKVAFENGILLKIQKELPESVKALARSAESK